MKGINVGDKVKYGNYIYFVLYKRIESGTLWYFLGETKDQKKTYTCARYKELTLISH